MGMFDMSNWAKKEALAGDRLPYKALLDENTVLLRDGSVMLTLLVPGLSFETADTAELDAHTATRELLLRSALDARFILYHHVVRRRVQVELDGAFCDPLAAHIDARWRAKLSSGALFVNDQFVSLIRRPARGKTGWAERLARTFRPARGADAGPTPQDLRELHGAANAMIASLSSYGARLLGDYEGASGQCSEILEFLSSLYNGEMRPVRKPTPHTDIGRMLPYRRINFGMDVTAGARGVYRGDPLRVRQILHNLISNALKFTSRGGVKIHISRLSGVLQISVKDTGIGIPEENIGQVFEKFEQLDASTTRRYGGSGLGLAISRDLAEMMGGAVVVTSKAGKGATFRVSLPLPKLTRSPLRQVKTPPAVTVEPSLMRILIAEDNVMNQLVLKTLLAQIGAETFVAPDGRAAIAAWEDRHWDLILMDIHMPNMDGVAATGEIRRREAARGLARTPIVALTANVMEHEITAYLSSGMDGFVAKPIDVERLLATIQDVAGA